MNFHINGSPPPSFTDQNFYGINTPIFEPVTAYGMTMYCEGDNRFFKCNDGSIDRVTSVLKNQGKDKT
jgi:hypothetical protein